MELIKLTLMLLSMALTLEAIPLSLFLNGPLASFFGRCPQRDPKEPFDGEAVKSKLVGRWYKHSSNVPELFTPLLKCSYIDFHEVADTNNYYSLEEVHFVPFCKKWKYSYKGTMEQDEPDAAKFDYTVVLPFIGGKFELSLQVLATDGKDYAILSVCKEFSSYFLHVESLVVLTKNPVVSDSVEEAIKLAIYDYLPNEQNKLFRISQSGCNDN